MSLLSALGQAAGGLGVAGGQLADDYIKKDAATQLQAQAAAIQSARDATLQSYAQANAKASGDQQVDVYQRKMNIDNDPTNVAADVTRTAALTKAKNDNTTHDLSPGMRMFDGQGNQIANNDTETTAQVNERLYREGLKGTASAQAGADAKAAAADKKAQQSEFFKTADPKNFKDADGNLDANTYATHVAVGRALLNNGATADVANSTAALTVQKAKDLATTLSQQKHGLLGVVGMGSDQTDPDLYKKNLAAIYAKLQKGDPGWADPKTYGGKSGDSDTPAGPRASDGLPPARSVVDRLGLNDNGGVPPPPPQTDGFSGRPNPAYTQWVAQYGDAYQAMQADNEAKSKAKAKSLLDAYMASKGTGRSYPAGAM